MIGFSCLEKEQVEKEFMDCDVDCVLTKPTKLETLEETLCKYFTAND